MSPADEVLLCRLEIVRMAEAWAGQTDPRAATIALACHNALDAFGRPDVIARLGIAAVMARDLGEVGAPLLAAIRRVIAVTEMDIRMQRATSPGGVA